MDWEIKKGITFHHHHVSLALIFVVVLVIVIVLLVKPALLGFKVSSEFDELKRSAPEVLKELDDLKSQVVIANTNLENCKSLSDDYVVDVSLEKDNLLKCENEVKQLNSNIEQAQKKFDNDLVLAQADFDQKKVDTGLELGQAKSDLKTLQSNYDTLVQNSANNICCKAKVDNPNVKFYLVSGNRIVCTVDSGNAINC